MLPNILRLSKNEKLLRLVSKRFVSAVSDSHNSLAYREDFSTRHIGVNAKEEAEMLKVLNVKSLDELVDKTVPKNIRLNRDLNLSDPLSKFLKKKKIF